MGNPIKIATKITKKVFQKACPVVFLVYIKTDAEDAFQAWIPITTISKNNQVRKQKQMRIQTISQNNLYQEYASLNL